MAETPASRMLFRYRARERTTGRLRTGETSGPDAYTVRSGLRGIGLDVEWIDEKRNTVPLSSFMSERVARFRCSRRVAQRADLCDSIATLLSAGLTLEKTLTDLAESPSRPEAERRLLSSLRDGVRQGRSLDQVAAEHPDWFDAIDLAMLSVGQRSGDLQRVLQEMSRDHQRGSDTAHTLIMALSYPALLLVAALGVVVFIGNQTLPKLLKILSDAKVPGPWLTILVSEVGQFLTRWWIPVLILVIVLFLILRLFLRRIRPGSPFAVIIGRLPVIRAKQRLRSASIATVLGRMLRNGIPLDSALETSAKATTNIGLRDLLTECANGIRRGERLSQMLGSSPFLDPEFGQMVQVGEQAGELAEMCGKIAERYERAAKRSIDRLSAIAEPAAILIMAVIVGCVVMAAILPLISLGDIL
jgi:type II secretory pathway component PulF